MSFEDWLEETDREIAELKKRNEAKMAKTLAEAKLRNEEVMLRASRALLAFKADVHKDIFIEENVLEF